MRVIFDPYAEGLAAAFFRGARLMFLGLSSEVYLKVLKRPGSCQFELLLELAWEMAALLLCFCSNMSSSSA